MIPGRHSPGSRQTSLAVGPRLGWMLVIVAAVLLPVVAWGAHVSAQGTETACHAGLVVGSGESCTYPGTTAEFSVDSSGRGIFLSISSGSSFTFKDTTINGVVYNFVAKSQRDGTWLIETAGDSVAPPPTPTATATPTPTPTPTPSADGSDEVPGTPANQRYGYDGSAIVLTWGASADADTYTVYHDDFFDSSCRLSSGSPSFCEELATDLGGTSYTHTSPDGDDNYYWVVACNSAGCSEIDSANPAAPSGTRPGTPANQRYEYDGSSIVLSWEASADADTYTVYHDDFFDSSCRLSSGSPSFCEELATDLGGTSYTHTSPDGDDNYYWVVACNSAGCSEIDSANPVQLGGAPPAAPANQRYEYDGAAIVLRWDASAGADTYTAYHDDFFDSSCRLSSGSPSFCEELATDLGGTSYTHVSPDLDENFYWLTACNNYGCSEIDSTNPVQLGGAPPAAPANQRYEYDGAAIVLTWDASVGADSYTVYYDDFFGSACRLGSLGPSFCEELASGLSGTSYTHASPDLDKNFYWVVACNNYGCSQIDSTNPVQLGGAPPAAPANQRYEYDGAAIVLTWDASVGADSYIVYYDDFFGSACRLGSLGPSFCEELASGLTGSSYTHADPDASRNFYWVVACNSYGCSQIDSTNPVQLGGAPPAAPANQRYEYDGAAIVLTWDASVGADSYIVYYDDFFGSACRLGSRGPSFCDELATGLTGTSYTHASPDLDKNHYWVVACNNYGCSGIESSARAELVGSAPPTSFPAQVTTPDGKAKGSSPATPVPDLVVGAPTVSSASPRAGASFSLSATVRNQGSGSASSTVLRYYRSSGPTITSADTAVGSEVVPGLGTSESAGGSVSLTAPATPGTYYYGTCVDAVSGEVDTTNNCSSAVTVTVGAVSVPGLVVDAPTVSNASPSAGSSFTLDATVRNEGDGSSPPTTLRFYRSSDPTITSADVAVGRDSVPSLSASQSADGSVNLTAPSTPGTYYYGACVDAVRGEADTTNNCSSAVAVTAGAAPAPGLVVDPPRVSELAPAAGASFTLSATVRNQGNGASSATTLRYYRSVDLSITTSDTAVGADPVPALDASQSADRSVSLTAPDTAGTYYYGACVDAVSGEADTANNCSSAVTVTVGAAPAPDLVVGLPTVSTATPDAGASFTLSATVHNQGNGASGSTRLRFYRSSDSTITSADSGVGSDPVPGLSASESAGGELSLTAPAAPGTYYYGACVDTVWRETDTTNNCSSAVTVTVGAAPAPDPVVSTPTVSSAAPRAGAPLTLSATVRNQGNGDADSTSTLRYYRSSDPTISSADAAVGSDPVPALGASQSAGGSVSLTAPATAGTYYYGACVDAVSGEADTTNNCSSAVTVTVGAAPAPGLVVDPPTVSELAPAAGGSFTLSATVHNQGSGSASSTRLHFYRSSDSTITYADTRVGGTPVPGLSASESAVGVLSLTVPAAPGTYYYGACVDAVPGEVDTANNCSSAVAVTVVGPDLVVESPTVSELAPAAGASFTLSATVRNQGNGASNSTTLRFYRSSDSTITSADWRVDIEAVPGLSASESAVPVLSLTAPAAPGTYYYGACVDTVGRETDRTNNCSSAVAVTVVGPDLVVDTPTVSELAPAAGASFTLSATVRNQGNGASNSTTLRFYLRFYWSSDSGITSPDTVVGTSRLSRLGPSESEDQVSLTAPAARGTYIYAACVDPVSGEADTANNCSSAVTVTVGAPPPPDLVVEPPTVSTTRVGQGRFFTVSATVHNQGNGASGSTTLRFHRSDDSTITTADTSVGGYPMFPVGPSQSDSGWVRLTARATPGTTYYYGACVDAVPGEVDTANNCSSAVAVTVVGLDLVVDAPTVSSASPPAGASFTLSATVRNRGVVSSSPTTLRYYESSDSMITTADTAVGSVPVSGLAVSGSEGASLSLTAPDTPGTYYYGACVDTDVAESDTTNNCSSAVAVTVTPPAPDLVVDAPTVSSASPPAGASFTLSATVRNQGTASSSPTTLRYYYEASLLYSTIAETAVGSAPVSGLDPSQNAARSVSLTTPATPGTYYYRACVDVATSESDATNNCSSAVEVRVAPDLVVEAPAVSDSAPAAGTSITLSATVRNVGNGHSWSTTVRYYRSSDSTITTADAALGSDPVPNLDAARSAGGSVSLTAPSTPGTYYYGACVDTDDTESDTTNNCSTAVVVTVAPDLVVDPPTISESAEAAGANLTLSATVRNQGNSASGSSTLHFYRSINSTITTADTAVGADLVSGLDAAQGADGSVSLAAPAPDWPRYYGACVDAVSGELETTNNCSAAVALGPDLVADTPAVNYSIQTVGEQFSIGVAVRNQGNTASGAARLSLYRSTNSTITSSDERIALLGFVSALSPSETTYLYGRSRAPSIPGTYYYAACVVSTAYESNTANNCSPALEIVVGQPDLVLDTLSVSPASPETGANFELRIDALHNQGNTVATFSTLRYYFSADASVTSTDTELAYELTGPMQPSSSYDIGRVGPFQAPSIPGTYYYGVCADVVSGEADTTNNCSVVTVTVRLPDLWVLLPTVSDSTPAAGARFTLFATVVNRGSSRSQLGWLDYYRSTDETITSEDTWVGSRYVGGLEPHEVSHTRGTLTAPSTAGTYYYGVCWRAGTADYCTEPVEVTAGDAQPSPLVLRTECFVFQNQDFVRFTVTARVPLTSLAVSTYRVEGRTNTRHLVQRVEVGDLAADSSYSKLTSRAFPAHLRRHLTTCTAGVEGYASVRPGFDPPAIMVPDPQPQSPADQAPVDEPLRLPNVSEAIELYSSLESTAYDSYTLCGYSGAPPCPYVNHLVWWNSLPAHIQPCAFKTCDFSND